jgi:hypothetical protein
MLTVNRFRRAPEGGGAAVGAKLGSNAADVEGAKPAGGSSFCGDAGGDAARFPRTCRGSTLCARAPSST